MSPKSHSTEMRTALICRGLTSGHAGDKQGPHKEPLALLLEKKHNAPAVNMAESCFFPSGR